MQRLFSNIQLTNLIKPFSIRLFGLILLFVLSQTAGIVHAVVHPFHADEHSQQHENNKHESIHGVNCDVFDHLAQQVNSASEVSFSFAKPAPQIPTTIELRSVFNSVYQPHFFGRAPPF